MIKKLSLIFGSKTKAQEILLLNNKHKEVVRQGFYEQELPKIEKFCQENDLHLVKSTFKVLLADETNYSNKGIRIPENDKRPGMYFVYISKNEEKAWLAAYYELMNNHRDLGKVLGYPNCCINYFTNNFSKNNTNPEILPTNAWTNITKRNEDHVLISHFPCSSDCQESILMARKNADFLMTVDKDRVREILNSLRI